MATGTVHSSLLRQVRQRLGPWIDRIATALGRPTTRVYPAGYVGTVPLSIEEIEAELQGSRFEWDPLSMYHYTLEGNDTDGSWAYRSSWFADRQLHAVLFAAGPETTEIYAHDEFNWSRHPFKHAKEVDIRRSEGSEEMRRWLESRDIEYERRSLPSRKIRHVTERIRERVRS